MIRLRFLRSALALGLPLFLTLRRLEKSHRSAGLSLSDDRRANRCRAIGAKRQGRKAHTTDMLRHAVAGRGV